jgi:hypothetical protein
MRHGHPFVYGLAAALMATVPLFTQSPAQAPADGQPAPVQVGVPRGGAGDERRDDAARQRAEEDRKRRAAVPIPKMSDGHPELGSTLAAKGIWLPGPVVGNPLGVKDVPYQPWTRALAADRRRAQLEPHTRCKPSGVMRQFLTPYGAELVVIPEAKVAYIFDIGGPHTFRTIYMDGRKHPANLDPSYYGHSIGWWEGDTLVVDTVGFNEGFWMDRGQFPHTSHLHTIEKFTRTDFITLRYEVTIDDPAAYTAPFSGHMDLRWEPDVELFEYVCQQSNYAPDLMLKDDEAVGRTNEFVP